MDHATLTSPFLHNLLPTLIIGGQGPRFEIFKCVCGPCACESRASVQSSRFGTYSLIHILLCKCILENEYVEKEF